jgi:coenzyme F420-reducing hydrogenase alpha subunit
MTEQGNGRTRTIAVDALARVEGEGAMRVTIRDGRVTDVALRIYEPPRFFEGLLRGRSAMEAPDITARICGICPVAYQTSAMAAVEDACGVVVPDPIRLLRRLMYCGEWIESHGLHVYMLHAPDFLGYHGAIEMARDHREIVERGLRVKKAGNDILRTVGGRSIHPVNVRVGGFYRAPSKAELAPLREQLARVREDALETLRWTGTLDFPELERDVLLVSLLPEGDDYPIERGRIVSTGGLDVPVSAFTGEFTEHQVPHSTALQAATKDGGRYMVGPMARFALAFDRLPSHIRDEALATGTGPDTRNPFRSIVVRSAEILFAFEEALRIIDGYEQPDAPFVEVPWRAAVGHGATEAPRGLLYQRYEIDDDGTITAAQITPPTAQNQAAVEDDMTLVVADRLDLPDDELRHVCEQAIRNYDPCISCSTHFLDLTVDRG